MLRQRGIGAVEYVTGTDSEATIHATQNGYVIRQAKWLPRTKARFSLAHEIGHTYFQNPDGRPWVAGHGYNEPGVESLCDYFARALLVPRDRLWRSLQELGMGDSLPPLHLIPSLACEYEVGEQTLARRLVFDLFGGFDAIACLTNRGTRSEPDWRAVWCTTAADALDRMPSGWRVPFSSRDRKVPAEMVPPLDFGQTAIAAIDGRWHGLMRPQPPSLSRKPAAAWPKRGLEKAIVGSLTVGGDLLEEDRQLMYVGI